MRGAMRTSLQVYPAQSFTLSVALKVGEDVERTILVVVVMFKNVELSSKSIFGDED